MENEEYIESGLSVGTMKIANKYEILTEEEIDAINNKIPELDERVDVIEDEIEEINSSLDAKASKNEVFSMANMGQDIKEAMTGGSVAVVGKNAVMNSNIGCGQVTPDKLSNKDLTINLSEMEILHTDKYLNGNGHIQTMQGWNIVKIELNENVFSFSFNVHNQFDIASLAELYCDGVWYGRVTAEKRNKVFSGQNKTILINHHLENTIGISSINLKYHKKQINDDMSVNLIQAENFKSVGIIKNGVIDKSFKDSYSVYDVLIDSSNFEYHFYFNAIGGYRGSYYNGTTYISDITQDDVKGILQPPQNCTRVMVNIYADKNSGKECDSFKAIKKKYIIQENSIISHSKILNKPYVFQNKKALFVGDSITRGYINGSTITNDKNYVVLTSQKLGLIYENKAFGGALFTPNINDVPTILQQLQSVKLSNYDYIFISAGTNDFGLGVPIDDFKIAVVEVCNYLKANFDKEVIFITPIDRVAPSNDEKAPLNYYRKYIADYAINNEFSVINGKNFEFPSSKSDITYDLLDDELHPSYKGYRHYAKCLCSALT